MYLIFSALATHNGEMKHTIFSTLALSCRMLRAHQWLKNLLLFLPMLAAHQLSNADMWLSLALAFFSFSLCASSVYIINDLLDIENDRKHPRKCKRPFASGRVAIWKGIALAPVLLFASIILATRVDGHFLPWLMIYFVVTCAYSLSLKRLVLLDCLVLAILYTLRIIAGASAANNALSFWFLAFSIFLFLSLAFVKRYAELNVQRLSGQEKIHGRGYLTSDAPLIQSLGVTAGYASAVVLALYLNSETVLRLYSAPEVIWGAIPVLLFWISWMWLLAHRGEMHDDPLVFAVKNKTSLLTGIVLATIMIMSTLHWSFS
jgi:4-hydroxybenzoate polyprenyltransferase